jgi:hypothetical protein
MVVILTVNLDKPNAHAIPMALGTRAEGESYILKARRARIAEHKASGKWPAEVACLKGDK